MILNASLFTQAKPNEQEINKLGEVLNIPTNHLVEEMGEHFYPTRGG